MASVKIRFNADRYKEKLSKMLASYGDLTPAMQDASEYMIRATQNRIYQGRKDPETGEPWAPLAENTVRRKGHSRPLFETGTLAQTIQAIMVGKSGFTIRAPARNSRGQQYASYLQNGARHPKTGKSTPARPFLGFSDQNLKRISKILSDHIKDAIR